MSAFVKMKLSVSPIDSSGTEIGTCINDIHVAGNPSGRNTITPESMTRSVSVDQETIFQLRDALRLREDLIGLQQRLDQFLKHYYPHLKMYRKCSFGYDLDYNDDEVENGDWTENCYRNNCPICGTRELLPDFYALYAEYHLAIQPKPQYVQSVSQHDTVDHKTNGYIDEITVDDEPELSCVPSPVSFVGEHDHPCHQVIDAVCENEDLTVLNLNVSLAPHSKDDEICALTSSAAITSGEIQSSSRFDSSIDQLIGTTICTSELVGDGKTSYHFLLRLLAVDCTELLFRELCIHLDRVPDTVKKKRKSWGNSKPPPSHLDKH